MLVGQALATANLCGECGGPLAHSVKTGNPCERLSPDAHYHEKVPVYGNGTVPVCCTCVRAAGIHCTQLEEGALE